MILAETMETVPFAEHEVDYARQVRTVDKLKEVRSVVVAKAAMDSHVRLLKEAGLRPKAVYSRPMALMHLAGISDGLIVQIDARYATIVLAVGGIPRVANQIAFRSVPGERWADRASDTAAAVDKVAERYDLENPGAGAITLPITLVGQSSSEPAFVEALRQEFADAISVLSRAAEYPEQFPVEEYSVNLGLWIAHANRGNTWKKPSTLAPPLNLLPARYLPRPFPVQLTAAYAGAAALVLGVVLLSNNLTGLTAYAATLTAHEASIERQDRSYRLAEATANGISVTQTPPGVTWTLLSARTEVKERGPFLLVGAVGDDYSYRNAPRFP